MIGGERWGRHVGKRKLCLIKDDMPGNNDLSVRQIKMFVTSVINGIPQEDTRDNKDNQKHEDVCKKDCNDTHD